MRTFINAYVGISVLMYALHKALAAYQRRHGETPALLRWHDAVHNIGHLLRIGLVLLVYYLIFKSAMQSPPQSFA